MGTYAIGDLQGCYAELNQLLERIDFDSRVDRLWFCGDLVNRGPDSLSCLRFVRELGESAATVLGNHDLHLLAVAAGHVKQRKRDTLDAILAAPDREDLLSWLSAQPLLAEDMALGATMVHAGLHPHWERRQAVELAREAEAALRGDGRDHFLREMYGDEPDNWSEDLRGWERLRLIINCLTRLRYCRRDGSLDLREKERPDRAAPGLIPWFAHPDRKSRGDRILFGHWSTLRFTPGMDFAALNVCPLDGGCLWGGSLIALRLEDGRRFSVPSRRPLSPKSRN